MKHLEAIPNLTSAKQIRRVLAFCFCLNSLLFLAQVAPGIEWRVSTWSPGGLGGVKQTQVQSGEEWWYSHKNVYNASGTHTAYVTVGYTSLVSTAATFTAAQQLYNEGPNSPYNPVNSSTFNYSVLPEGCSDRDYLGEHRTSPRGNIGMNALDGTMIYCKPKTIGALEEVIQDPDQQDYFYVVGLHMGVRPYKNKTDFIPYNPTLANPADYFSLQALGVTNYTNEAGHVYIAKINTAGTVIWEGLYGAPDYSVSALKAYEALGYGYDIIKSSNGHLIATGFSASTYQQGSTGVPVLLEIDPATGYLINKSTLNVTNSGLGPLSNPDYGYVTGSMGRSLVEIGNSQIYAVAVTSLFENTTDKDRSNAFIWAVDKDFNLTPTWQNNPLRLNGNSPTYNSSIAEIKYHSGLKQLLVPVVKNCSFCAWAGGSSGYGYIYRLDSSGTLSPGGVNPSIMGYINAFDLRIGVEPTSDNGFAAVSSVRPPGADHSPPTSSELGYLSSCTSLDMTDWDTDALIMKFNSSGETEWCKTFDAGDNRQRVPPPGDLKRQECMYKITQAQDGGLVISGNSSGNFDDNYMAKLYNDCNARQTYTSGPNNEIHIASSTVWNAPMNVLGKVIIHPGATLIIDGARICFADSKLTGIETNVTVKNGARLSMINNASFTGIDSAKCGSSSKWDGVKYEPDITEEGHVTVYPNPAASSFYFIFNGEGTVDFVIHDVVGKEILSGAVGSDFAKEVNTSTFAQGVYFISVFKNKKMLARQKLVVIKN